MILLASILLMFFSFFISTSYSYESSSVLDSLSITLASPNPQVNGYFGHSASVYRKLAVIGAPEENSSGYPEAGRAYIFNSSTGLLVVSLSSPNGQSDGFFGFSVCADDQFIIIGARGESINGLSGAGAVYVFSAKNYSLLRELVSPNAQTSGSFGWSVSLAGTLVMVGAPQESVGGMQGAGDAYVFNATSGNLVDTLSSPNAQSSGFFGWSVAISSNNIAIVGAFGESVNGVPFTGHAYIFKATTGKLIKTLTAPNAVGGDEFGISVAATSELWVVGAPAEPAGGYFDAGNAYVFNATNGGGFVSKLTSPHPHKNGVFGIALSASKSETVLVGAPGEPASMMKGAGRAYLFSLSGVLLKSFESSNTQASGFFGSSVSIYKREILAGAPGETVNGNADSGRAYLF